MQNSNIIGIYSTVITDPTTQYRFDAQFSDAKRVDCGGEGPRETSKVVPLKMTKLVLNCSYPDRQALQNNYPHLHRYMDVYQNQSLSKRCTDIRGSVVVHLDPLFSEVLKLQNDILTSKMNAQANSTLNNELRTTERALSVQTDLANAYKKRVDNFNNLSVWTKLLHVVIAWFKDHKAV